MDRARLAELIRPEREVEHDGQRYRLVLAGPKTVAAVQHAIAPDADRPEGKRARKRPEVSGPEMTERFVRAMNLAVQGCLQFDDGEAVTDREAASVVIHTGGLGSEVGRTALELCGVRLNVEDAEDPDELPSS